MSSKDLATKQIQNWWLIFVIGAAIIIISALHFLTPLDRPAAHQIYQRLYYLPVVAAALFATVAYVPHIAFQWHHQPEYALNQYAEIVLFFSFGLVTGALSDRNRHERERTKDTMRELERSYAELRQTFEQLLQAERLAAIGELSAGIVHEIRNPLGAIKGAVEILEDALENDHPRREFAEIAKTEVDRLNKLVQEFVEFARSPKPNKSPINIDELINSVNTLIGTQAAEQQVVVETEFASELPWIEVDGDQIKQVLLNLALNALEAMPAGGALCFRAFRKADAVIIEVENTGDAIPSNVIDRIFDPFFTTKNKGIGLGLSIARKIVTDHGGQLRVSNNVRGAVFTIDFIL